MFLCRGEACKILLSFPFQVVNLAFFSTRGVGEWYFSGVSMDHKVVEGLCTETFVPGSCGAHDEVE